MVIEKVKARAEQMKSTMSGDAGILNTLKGEHAEVSELFSKLEERELGAEKRRDLLGKLRKNLLAHAKAEEMEFYSVCAERTALAGLVRRNSAEHKQMESLLVKLDKNPADSSGWMDQVRELKQIVEAHVAQEENELFPKCAEEFSASELRDLDRKYKDRKDSVQERLPNPRRSDAPNTQRGASF